jgi:hypothetical protein
MKERMNSRHDLDQLLNAEAQQGVAKLVRDLKDEEPDMAWRAALSSKIMEQSVAVQRRRKFNIFLKPASGLALASCLALAVVVSTQRPQTVPSNPAPAVASASIEKLIIDEHQNVAYATDVSGVGLAQPEANYERAPRVADDPILVDFFQL